MYDQDNAPQPMADQFLAELCHYMAVYESFRNAGESPAMAMMAAECSYPCEVFES